jgi:hypothetical protein
MKLRHVILSRDFLGSLVAALAVLFVFYPVVTNDFAKDLYTIGISVLAIVFSVYFAALAVIISAGDNEFIKYLEQKGRYTRLITTFRFSLIVLFLALIYSLAIYTLTSFWQTKNIPTQSVWFTFVFTWLSLYGLFASAMSSLDAINYAKYRTIFLKADRGKTPGTDSN